MSQEFVILQVKEEKQADTYVYSWCFENGVRRVNKVIEAKLFTSVQADHIIEIETEYKFEKVKVTVEV